MYFFIEKYKISHQMVTFPWKELPDFHIFSHHVHVVLFIKVFGDLKPQRVLRLRKICVGSNGTVM